MLSVICKACGASFYVPQEVAGQETKCGACGRTVLVPLVEGDLQTGVAVPEKVEGAWEYLVVADRGRLGHVDQNKLNEFGAKGWELVTVYREHPDANTNYYFKRPHGLGQDRQ